MRSLAELCEAISATTKKSEKVALVSRYIQEKPVPVAALAVQFLSGYVVLRGSERKLQVGGSLLWRVVASMLRHGETALSAAYSRHRDLGSAACEVLQPSAPNESSLSLFGLADSLTEIAAARGPEPKAILLKALFSHTTAIETKYIVRLILGEMRIGLKESLVEEAIAKAFDRKLSDVQRANMLLGDIGETLRLASTGHLAQAKMRLFHPIAFMLATPAANAEEAFPEFSSAIVEDKYDGIRAQAHISGQRVELYTRTLENVTDVFPELAPHLCAMRDEVILDGEILAWQNGRARPFSDLQKRLGRKRVTPHMIAEVPVAYVCFDLLALNGDLLIDLPLEERQRSLDAVLARRARVEKIQTSHQHHEQQVFEFARPDHQHPRQAHEHDRGHHPDESRFLRAPSARAESPDHLEHLFVAAQERANEGLMIKDPRSPYTPGRRGRYWLKLKRELATLDVVVTAVESGNGKRAGVLSDYTFAVREGDRLVNIGKAYTGLTDAEIAEMTRWFEQHTISSTGALRQVEPKIVVEVAFNAVMRSERHNQGGFALRFPRIVRLRPDKPVGQIDTLQRLEEIYREQIHLRKTA